MPAVQRAIGKKDFRATYAGTCEQCGERYEPGTVIINSVWGYVHAVCPGEADFAARKR